MDEVYEFLKKCQTYYLATVDKDQPRVRAFGTIKLFEGKLYLQTGKSKDVYHQIKANPLVELIAFDGQQWVRVSATLVEDDRIEPQQALLEDYPSLQGRYQPGDGNNVVFALEDVTATFSTFGSTLQTVTF